MKASIIIPAVNEVESIGLVLGEIPMHTVEEVIVVDNGSTDGTGAAARRHGAITVREARRGYGAACLRGISEVNKNSEIVVFLDADHSDFPEDLPAILEPIERGYVDFVIGSRVLGTREKGALQWSQRFGNALASVMIRWLYGVRFTDMGPFRAIRKEKLLALGMKDQSFGWNVEMQVKAIALGLRIAEVPVRYRRRIGKSKISGTVRGTVMAGVKIIGTILMYYPEFRRVRGGRRK